MIAFRTARHFLGSQELPYRQIPTHAHMYIKCFCPDRWKNRGTFRSQLGEGTGKWRGSQPSLNTEYDVELEISEKLKWDVSIFVIDNTSPSISSKDGLSTIVGELDNFIENTVASIRIGDDVVLVDLDDNQKEESRCVMIRTASLLLYNMNM